VSKLEFEMIDAVPEAHPATPALRLRLRVRVDGPAIDAIALRVRVQIEPWRRRHMQSEEALLTDLSLSTPLQWSQTAAALAGFERETAFEVPVPCTYDLQVAADKYLTALEDGSIPVRLFFNGTIFRGAPNGFNVEMLPWDLECAGEVGVEAWQRALDACFSGQAWIRVDRGTYDALRRYRSAHRNASWDETMNALLAAESIEGAS
jgi:hypothetical protein